MAVNIGGTNDSGAINVGGSNDIGAVYVGSQLVWQKNTVDPNALIIEVTIPTGGYSFRIPFYNTSGYACYINFGDGYTSSLITSYSSSLCSHTYTNAGTYNVQITGTCKGLYFNNTGNKLNLRKIIQWGNVGLNLYGYSFYGCTNLSSIDNNIPSSITSIGFDEFANCTSITSFNIPSSITSIGQAAFQGCTSLQSINIPSSITSISQYAFQGCTALQSVDVSPSASFSSINYYTFHNCTALQSINIPSSVISINDYAFYNCSALQSITIPSSVTSIGSRSFYICSNQSLIYTINPTTPPTISSNTFSGIAASAKIKVPAGSVTAYKTAQYWSSYANRIISQ